MRLSGFRQTLVTVGCALLASAGAHAAAQICDASTALTLIGMDTHAGRVLFAVPPLGAQGPAWLLELDGAGRDAHAYPETAGMRFSGSVGPGPILAVETCGRDCVQPVRWNEGSWSPLGEPLTLPAAATLAATYDGAGTPWLVAHGVTATAGQRRAWAFRLEGAEWHAHGALDVTAVGQPQTLPAPQQKDGVITGTGLFSAAGSPTSWLGGLPALPAERRGQVLALAGSDAAYVSSDGVVYLSSDAGKKWRRSTWTPWGGETVGMWRQGSDYSVDLPFGETRGALQLVWFDRRNPAEEKVLITRLNQNGDWALLAETAADVLSKNGQHLPVTQVLVPQADAWILLSGCAATAEGSGLVLRTFGAGQISAPRFVPIQLDSQPAAAPPP